MSLTLEGSFGGQRETTCAVTTPGVVGPNAVVQLAAALDGEPGGAERVFRRAGHARLLVEPPTAMIDERIPARLFAALYAERCPTQANRIARVAGRRTADYVIANRIPRIARTALPLLPSPVALGLLMRAIRRSAWTFAGSGACTITTRPTARITIAQNPLAMPGCAWHAAVFARMVERLVHAPHTVRHLACCREGADACLFEITPHDGRRDGTHHG